MYPIARNFLFIAQGHFYAAYERHINMNLQASLLQISNLVVLSNLFEWKIRSTIYHWYIPKYEYAKYQYGNLKYYNLSPTIRKVGNPWPDTPMAEYMDHLKGKARKDAGETLKSNLK